MFVLLCFLACAKKSPETAKPTEVEDLGNGSFRFGTVVVESIEIKEKLQEDSLNAVETKAKEEDDGSLEKIAEVEELLRVYEDFIQYEYGEDDEKNADYLVVDKMKVFHQLTGSAYDIVMAERNYYEVSAGIYVAGAAELRYAEMWNRYPTPDYLDHNSKVLFGERVRDTVDHLGEEGKDKLERIIAHYFRSMVSGEYTLSALEELQMRFPDEYPKPVSDKADSALLTYYQYEKFQDEEIVDLPSKWRGTDQQQTTWIARLEEGEALTKEVEQGCAKMPAKYLLLGEKVETICQIQEYAALELLIYDYPVPKISAKMQSTQRSLEKLIQEKSVLVQKWEQDARSLFWKKEANMLLRSYQFAKVKAMRKSGRAGVLNPVEWDVWSFQEPEEIDKPTADILDAHLLQIERVARIMNYDINDLNWDDRAMVLRMMYVEFPQQLQELERSIQATLFAFPEDSNVRSRLIVALVESYSHYLYFLPKLQTEDSKDSIASILAINKPFSLGLSQIVLERDIEESLKKRLEASVERLNGDVLQAPVDQNGQD